MRPLLDPTTSYLCLNGSKPGLVVSAFEMSSESECSSDGLLTFTCGAFFSAVVRFSCDAFLDVLSSRVSPRTFSYDVSPKAGIFSLPPVARRTIPGIRSIVEARLTMPPGSPDLPLWSRSATNQSTLAIRLRTASAQKHERAIFPSFDVRRMESDTRWLLALFTSAENRL